MTRSSSSTATTRAPRTTLPGPLFPPSSLSCVCSLPPDRARAEAKQRLATDLARRDFKPDFTVQAGYMNRGGLDPMWQAGVGVNLPLFRGRRHAAVAEAEAGRRAAALQVDAVRAQIAAGYT